MTDIFQTISVSADIAIIFLLAVQSWVLVKLLPEIKRTAANSNYFTNTLAGVKEKIGFKSEEHDKYPQYLKDVGIFYCRKYNIKGHVHTSECYHAFK